MKRINVIFIFIILIPFFCFSKTAKTFDYVSPFHEGFSAVKSGSQWRFINKEGNLVVDFRDLLFSTKIKDETYPIFINNRCIIIKKEVNISYLVHIDTSGKAIIKPTYLKATNFQNVNAIVLELYNEIAGYIDIMGKDIVYYTYIEVIININGKVKQKLTSPKNVMLSNRILPETSKIISEKVVIILNEHKKWTNKNLDK